MTLVQKFGGGILTNKSDFQRAAHIIKKANPDAVVVSAVQGVTDKLIHLLEQAKSKQIFEEELNELKQIHLDIVRTNTDVVENVFEQIEKTLKGISYTREYSEKLYAQLVSRGEYLSALLLAEYVDGYSSWPAENGIIAKGNYLNSRADMQKIHSPPAKSVVTGFYGVNVKGEICLFGRGGSDYSAAVVAKALKADKVEFWKNVDGFMTADPRITPNAQFISHLSFEEAAELCRFGAKILHPSALEPLEGTLTRVEIKNVLSPEKHGTIISSEQSKTKLSAITGRKQVAAVSVSGNEMVEAFGIAAKILTKVADAGISVDAIATAQANVSFTVEEKDSEAAVNALSDLKQFEVKNKTGLALIGIVGTGVKTDPLTTSRVFSALAGKKIQVEMISQGASEIDLSLVVKKEAYESAIETIHAEFFGGKK